MNTIGVDMDLLKGKTVIVTGNDEIKEIMIFYDMHYVPHSDGNNVIPIAMCMRANGKLYFAPAERIQFINLDAWIREGIDRYKNEAFEMVSIEEFKEGKYDEPVKLEGEYYLKDMTTKVEDIQLIGIQYDYLEIGHYYARGTVDGRSTKIEFGDLYRLKDGWRVL